MSLYKDASLVMIPSAYKDGKLYSIRPTDGSGDFTFSRGSNLAATRVDVNGLIEKGRENLLLQSNQFDTTWAAFNTTLTSGQSGYDGSSDAWLFDSTSYIYQSISVSGVHTISVYAKKATANEIRLRIRQASDANAFFDLVNGLVLSTYGDIKASITDVSNGWYRCEIAFVASSTINFRIYPNDGESIYIQDAQLEAGLVATDYIETGASTAQAGILEDMPRLDYSGGASCPALLLEPQRTNRFAHSEYSGGFSSGSAITITDNATTSPEGLQNAIKITKSANGYAYFRGSIPADTGTLSVFAKKGNYRYIGLRNNQVAGNDHSVFDFDTETFVNVASGQTCTYEDYGDGWYRLSAYQPTNESSGYVGIALSDENGAELVGSSIADGSHFYIYGLQLESASYPTSYIPTYGSSVTRSQDSAITTFPDDSIVPTSGSTLFFDIELGGLFKETPNVGGFYLRSNDVSLLQFNFTYGYNRIYSNYVNGSSAQIITGVTEGQRLKCAFQFTQGGKLFVNGINTHTTSQDYSTKDIGRFEISKGHSVNQAVLFPTILTDAECIALTTI